MASPVVSKTSFSQLPSELKISILSCLDDFAVCRFFTVCKSANALKDESNFYLERRIFSHVEIFDQARWKNYFDGGKVTDEYNFDKIDITVLRAFLRSYYGPNPIGPGRVCDNCLIPTLVPGGFWRQYPGYLVYENHSLSLLEKLAEKPKKGPPAKYSAQTRALEQHAMTPAQDKTRLVIQLKGVIARNKPWSEQIRTLKDLFNRTGWGCLPDALSQNTLVFAHHAMTGERPLGDPTGIEGCWTYGRTKERVLYGQNAYPMISGGFMEVVPIEGPARAELAVSHYSYDYWSYGVVVLRKF